MAQRHSFFATCAPGVEAFLFAEVRALKLPKPEQQVGGVYFEGDLTVARRANLWLRTAIRILMRVERFPCSSDDELYAAAKNVEWERYLGPDGSFIVDAQTKDSELTHSRFLEQRVKDALVDRFREHTGRRPNIDREHADLGIHVHLSRDRCTMSIDTSGHALHKRGWRRHQGKAPLAETLAATMLSFSEWDGRAPLIDPFCGSGTIPIEAGLMALGVAPGLFSPGFGFERWRGHDARAWELEKKAAREAIQPRKKLRILGYDRDASRVEEARENAEAAGVAEVVHFEVQDVRDFAPKKGWNAWVVSNLPYGERVGKGVDLEDLYRRFGAALRQHCAGYQVALLCPQGPLPRKLGLKGASHPLLNGGLDCRVLCAAIRP